MTSCDYHSSLSSTTAVHIWIISYILHAITCLLAVPWWSGWLKCLYNISRDYQGKEWIPHMGPLTKVIPLKLFLDMVLSYSANIYSHLTSLRGQPKWLSRNYRSRNGGNVMTCFDFVSSSRDVLCTLSRSFCSSGLSFVLCSFCCSLFGRLFHFREFNGNEYNGCVSVRYNSFNHKNYNFLACDWF